MKYLIKDKVYYKIFDLSCKKTNYIYSNKDKSLKTKYLIKKNKDTIINLYNAKNILLLNQEHSNKVIDADLIKNFNTQIAADASITTKKLLILGIQTADCIPLLISSIDGKVIGAAHCGWKGAKNGIVENLINKMQIKSINNNEFYAIIGPSITQTSYEVDKNFYNNFINDDINNQIFYINSTKDNHYLFDLRAYVENKLKKNGITQIQNIEENTFDTKLKNGHYKYPSYRRSCATGEPFVHSILSSIMINRN